MFGKKLILIAATVALALGNVSAHSEAAKVRLHVRQAGNDTTPAPTTNETIDETLTIDIEIDDDESTCFDDESPMSVEGVEGIFCVSGQSCVAEIDGECPGPQDGLPYGSYCDRVQTGVLGCKPFTEPQEDSEDSVEIVECTGDDVSPMSVEGVEGVFCVSGQACVAEIDGACPGPQDGLEYGAYCGRVQSGVLGCKPYTEDQAKKSKHSKSKETKKNTKKVVKKTVKKAVKKAVKKSAKKNTICPAGQSPMSVEGVEGVFCVSGQSCVAEIDGACPGPQNGLQYGAYCDRVKTGVLGCKPHTKESYEAWLHEMGQDTCSGPNTSPMSVEGVEGVFCVTGQACVAEIDGACPGAQEGLEYGAYCGRVVTGVLGCKPHTPESLAAVNAAKKHKKSLKAKKHSAKKAAKKHHHKH